MEHLEKKCSYFLPESISTILEGWSHAGIYCVTAFLTFSIQDSIGCGFRCVAISPLENENVHSDEGRVKIIKYVLALYKQQTTVIAAVIAENCPVHRVVAREFRRPFIDSENYTFNLAVNDVITMQLILVENFKAIMVKLCFPIK